MKTHVHLTITDTERLILAEKWFSRKQMVSRKEVVSFVETQIQLALLSETVEPESARETEDIVTHESPRSGDSSIRPFVPSRGDESYLCKPKSGELAAACSQVLDGLEFIETFAWENIERNRK